MHSEADFPSSCALPMLTLYVPNPFPLEVDPWLDRGKYIKMFINFIMRLIQGVLIYFGRDKIKLNMSVNMKLVAILLY